MGYRTCRKIYMQSDDMIPRTEALMIVSKLTDKNFTDVRKTGSSRQL